MVNVKRYYARTAREALRMVKEELGSDAVVLSNRSVDGGVEILALPASEVGAVQAAAQPKKAAPQKSAAKPANAAPRKNAAKPDVTLDDDADDFRVSLSTRIARPATEQAPSMGLNDGVLHLMSDRTAQIRPFTPRRVDNYGDSLPPAAPQPAKAPEYPYAARAELLRERSKTEPSNAAARKEESRRAQEAESERVRALEDTNARLIDEMGTIREMLERQLAGFAWGELTRGAPIRAQVMSDLLEAGFSAQLARELAETVPQEAAPETARTHLRAQINRRLLTLESEADLIERGGVYALVGPTGVGKTTTTAKLAARCVVRHGAEKLALITTDSYRIGAHEQLRIYGRILGVQVHTVRDAADLRRTLQDLSNKHMILIDTIGMSHRDQMVAEQAAMLAGAGCIKRLLLLNATAHGDTLEDVLHAYEGADLAGCILTKTDEASSLAPALDVLIRHELRAYYIANGQRVPEDLHMPNRAWLVHRSLRELAPESPFRMSPEEAGLLAAGRSSRLMQGGRV
ncbi:MAG: flagellar biosynthesis protein FlhF [Betaproteobacteria bacterium]|nr:flagellar biosynthesis protein FlhF [Betaproteobacteria bacterium]